MNNNIRLKWSHLNFDYYPHGDDEFHFINDELRFSVIFYKRGDGVNHVMSYKVDIKEELREQILQLIFETKESILLEG